MARKTRVILIDDIDGSEASRTVSVALDGVSYEIDLRDAHAEQLREQIDTWASSARRVGGRRRAGSHRSRGDDPERTAKIRKWARENDYRVNARGRIAQNVIDAYAAAR